MKNNYIIGIVLLIVLSIYFSFFIKERFTCTDLTETSNYSRNIKLIIHAIPESNKITLVWKWDKNININKFIILYSNVANNEIRFEEVSFNTVNNSDNSHNIYQKNITDLENNIKYKIVINALYNDNNITFSNTLEVTPSIVNIIDYTKCKENTSVQSSNLAASIFNNLQGKTFDISI
jgi:hypothetical protein